MNNKTVSLFSGGGGLDLGFKQAGYDIVWAIDNNQDAVNTYKRNVGNEIMYGDITTIDIHDIPKADIVIGGPPCQWQANVNAMMNEAGWFGAIWKS